MSPAEEATVQRLLREHFPDELNIDSALWTRAAVQSLIGCECGIKMPIRTVGEYLKRWGYTPQKQLKRALAVQDPQAVKAWLESEYPAIEQRAYEQDAEIAWGDESGLRTDMLKSVEVTHQLDRHQKFNRARNALRVNYIASISNQGKVRFMLYTRQLTAQVFITFLNRLIALRTHKLMWIVDRHPVHRSQAVQQWLHEHQDKIEMHFLPPYSPQLNPAEYLNPLLSLSW